MLTFWPKSPPRFLKRSSEVAKPVLKPVLKPALKASPKPVSESRSTMTPVVPSTPVSPTKKHSLGNVSRGVQFEPDESLVEESAKAQDVPFPKPILKSVSRPSPATSVPTAAAKATPVSPIKENSEWVTPRSVQFKPNKSLIKEFARAPEVPFSSLRRKSVVPPTPVSTKKKSPPGVPLSPGKNSTKAVVKPPEAPPSSTKRKASVQLTPRDALRRRIADREALRVRKEEDWGAVC